MKIMKSLMVIILSLFLIISACSLVEPELKKTTVSSTEAMYFSRFVALGDNIISGYQSAALTEKHQKYSFVNQIAKQATTPDFQQPLLGYPGLGSESYAGYGVLELKYLDNPATPYTVNPDPVIFPVAFADYPDFDPLNMPYISEDVMNYPLPYSNLGIPGIILEDVLIGISKLNSRSHSGMIDVILRNPAAGNLTAFEQAKAFVPSIIACWIGMYDVLGYAQFSSTGQKLSEPTSKDKFSEFYAQLMDSLITTQAVIIVGNIQDITKAPYFNVVPPVIIDTVTNTPLLDGNNEMIPLIGVNPETDLVLFPAKQAIKQGYGIPTTLLNGNGEPIPEDMVLNAQEIDITQQAVLDYNEAIDSICTLRGIPIVDMYTFYEDLSEYGHQVAGFTFTDTLITGGFYSLDGIHPSSLGNALIANNWLETMNKSFHISIPFVNIIDLMRELQPADSLANALNQHSAKHAEHSIFSHGGNN